jgi:hypothetical protein
MRMTGEAASADTVGVIHCIGWGCQSSNSQEIHCIKWEYFVQFVRCFAGMYPWCKMGSACNTTNSISAVFLSSHSLFNWPLYSNSRFIVPLTFIMRTKLSVSAFMSVVLVTHSVLTRNLMESMLHNWRQISQHSCCDAQFVKTECHLRPWNMNMLIRIGTFHTLLNIVH